MIGWNFNTFSESTSVEFRDADVSHLLAIASAFSLSISVLAHSYDQHMWSIYIVPIPEFFSVTQVFSLLGLHDP